MNHLFNAEYLMDEGGALPLDLAVAFMGLGMNLNDIDPYLRDVEFEITPQLLDNL